MNLTPIQYNLQNIKVNTIMASVLGNHRGYVWNRKLLAAKATEHFDEFISLPKREISIPLFSRPGFNMLYVAIKDLFRKKTPEEKLLKKMLLEHKMKNMITNKLLV